jgi:MFS family permease
MEDAKTRKRTGDARASFLAWSLAAVSVALWAAQFLLFVLARAADVPESWDVNFSLAGQATSGVFLVFPLVGVLVASRHPKNPIGWVLLADGLLWMLSGVLDYYAVYGMASVGSVPFPLMAATVNNWLWVPAVGLLGTFVFLLFPDGQLPSGRWRPLAWSSGAVISLASLGVAISPGRLANLGGVRNPLGLEGYPWLFNVMLIFLLLLPLCMALSAASLVLRFRRSRGEERQQIKWIAFAASVVGLLYLAAMSTAFLYPSESWFQPGSRWWFDFLAYAALLSFTLVPTAVGVAILRYRLYDIDLIINRTLVYGSLTLMLALVYLGGVATMQASFRAITGMEQQPQLSVVVSTLAIAALFNPLRRRIQSFIDRSFYRKKYDARNTLEAFSARLRDETDLDDLSENLVDVVRETLQPRHAYLWLREPDGTGVPDPGGKPGVGP